MISHNSRRNMQRFSCDRQEVTQPSNVDWCSKWEIGRCRCAEDSLKLRCRIRELTGDLVRLTSAAGDDDSICVADPVLNRTLPRREKIRGILEEIMRLESLLEVLEGCKNVFRTEKSGRACQQAVDCLTWPLKTTRTTTRGTDCTNDADVGRRRQLPEYLLSPLRTNAVASYSLGRQRKERRVAEPWWNTSGAGAWRRTSGSCVDVSSMRSSIDDDNFERCRQPRQECEEDNCILVYGFPPEAIDRIILNFSLVGDVVKKKVNEKKNWLLIWYRHSYDASQACGYDLCAVNGAVIGVTRWSPSGADPSDAVRRRCGLSDPRRRACELNDAPGCRCDPNDAPWCRCDPNDAPRCQSDPSNASKCRCDPGNALRCRRDPGDAHPDDTTGVIRVRKHLRFCGGKVEEFTPRKRDFRNFISRRCIVWSLLFIIMWFIVWFN